MFSRNLLCQAAPIFVLLAWLDVLIGVRATAINTTIDDADSRIQYSDHWNAGGDCNDNDVCSALVPEEERKNAYLATWHDASNWEADRHFNVTFTGSACYVFAILRNGNQAKIGYSTLANITFIMDGKVVGQFEHEPSREDQWLFNQLVFSKEDMNEDSHKLTVRLKPRSFLIFDYLKITSKQSTPPTTSPPNNKTAIVASTAAVIGSLVFIGLIVLWLFYRRRRRGVRVIVPRDQFLPNHPRRVDSPPAHISPFYGTPQYAKVSHSENDGDHEGVRLLAGAQATGDRKRKYSLYDVPEAPGSSHSLHNPLGPQIASTPAANRPRRRSSPQPTTATYAPSTKGGIRETVYIDMPPDYERTASETAPSTQAAAIIPLRPLRSTLPPSQAPPPAQPNPHRMSLYVPAVTGAETSQKNMRP